MALVKSVLAGAIKAAFKKQAAKKGEQDDPAKSIDEIAEDLATAIDDYIKSGTVTTTVTGTSPAGPVTGAGTGSVS